MYIYKTEERIDVCIWPTLACAMLLSHLFFFFRFSIRSASCWKTRPYFYGSAHTITYIPSLGQDYGLEKGDRPRRADRRRAQRERTTTEKIFLQPRSHERTDKLRILWGKHPDNGGAHRRGWDQDLFNMKENRKSEETFEKRKAALQLIKIFFWSLFT